MKRFDIAQAINGGVMVESPEDGDYVLYDEAAAAIGALEASHQAHKALLAVLCAVHSGVELHHNLEKDIADAIEASRAAIAAATRSAA